MSEKNKVTGKCAKCGKTLQLSIDGCCTFGHELCYECWIAAGRECPVCNGEVKS